MRLKTKAKEHLSLILGLKRGNFQRRPRIYDALYLLHSAQLKLLKRFIKEYLKGAKDLIVLDLGCGDKPYMEFFSPYTAKYIGCDVNNRKGVDIVCPAETVNLPDESCDIVISIQTIEHVNDPLKVLGEIYRLLKKRGQAFLTIPGCFCYHPGVERYIPGMEVEGPTYPDYWRWTQAGIIKLIGDNFAYRQIGLESIGGFFQCFGLQLAFLITESTKSINKYLCYLTMFTIVPVINIFSLCLDKIFFKWNRLWSPYTIFLGYAIILKK